VRQSAYLSHPTTLVAFTVVQQYNFRFFPQPYPEGGVICWLLFLLFTDLLLSCKCQAVGFSPFLNNVTVCLGVAHTPIPLTIDWADGVRKPSPPILCVRADYEAYTQTQFVTLQTRLAVLLVWLLTLALTGITATLSSRVTLSPQSIWEVGFLIDRQAHTII
jgi:hypothetical protein